MPTSKNQRSKSASRTQSLLKQGIMNTSPKATKGYALYSAHCPTEENYKVNELSYADAAKRSGALADIRK